MLRDIFSALGGLGGITSICYIAIWGGRVDARLSANDKWHDHMEAVGGANQIAINTKHLDEVEVQGTRALQGHIQMDQTRVDEMSRRLATLETAVMGLQEMRGDVRVIRTKVDAIEQQLFNNGTNGNGKVR